MHANLQSSSISCWLDAVVTSDFCLCVVLVSKSILLDINTGIAVFFGFSSCLEYHFPRFRVQSVRVLWAGELLEGSTGLFVFFLVFPVNFF